MTPALRRWAIVVGGLFGGCLLLMGIAHTPWAAPALAWLAPALGCPVSLANVDAREVEAFRIAALRAQAGEGWAERTPALGFQLGSASRREVEGWLSQFDAECAVALDGAARHCPRLRLARGEPDYDAHLQFDPAQRLVAVDLQQRETDGGTALRRLRELNARLEHELGPAAVSELDVSAEQLSAQRFRRAGATFSFQNYRARLSVMNYGSMFVLRQQYQWLPASTGSARP